jgi:PAS domain S-box-containing protein
LKEERLPDEELNTGAPPGGRPRILLVDDHRANLVALEAILAPLGAELIQASTSRNALRAVLSHDFAVILLDVQLPEMDGFELAAVIKTRERSRRTPIIFLTAIHSEPSKIFLGYAQGAVDYLLKPFDPEILRSKVSVFVELWKQREQIKEQQERIHAQERAEQERKSDLRYRMLTDSMPGCIWAATPDGQIYYANRRWLEYSGRQATPEGFGFFGALPPEDEARVRAEWLAAIRDRKRIELEVRLHGSDGAYRWHLLRTEPELDETGAPVNWIASAFEVDTQKRMEEERQQLLAREQAARAAAEVANRAKDDFLATVSHELRTPLTAILGWTRMLRTGAVVEAAIPRALETVERNARVQAQLIEDILDVSRIVSGKMRVEIRRLDLRLAVQAAVEAAGPGAQAKGVELVPDICDGLIECFADPGRLQQICWNLIANAIKFTPRGGRVTAQLSREGSGEDARGVVSIADTGAGISSAFLPHVFERFRQEDSSMTRSQGGLGLGLAIVRHLVELHGGRVEAFSDGEGRGARFVVRLPLAQPTTVEVPALLPEMRPLSLSGLKVLVVDDEPDALDLVVQLLRTAGAQVCTAADANQAVDALLLEVPDVLLSDVGLPREDGYALLRRVRALDSLGANSVPAVALTEFGTAEDGRLAAEAGYQRHLPKLIEPAVLVAVIRELAGRIDELQERRARAARQQQPTAATR